MGHRPGRAATSPAAERLRLGAPDSGADRADHASPDHRPGFLPSDDLGRLLELLGADGRRVIGPVIADGAIGYDEVRGVADLPVGWTDRQAPGDYRLEATGTARRFDYAVGPTSWKRFVFPPRVPVTTARRDRDGVEFEAISPDAPPIALLGVRACEIAALLTQDRILMAGTVKDDDYAARRAAALVIAVECVAPASTCFCTSTGTGPEVTGGFDLALTELDDGFIVRAGSDAGRDLADRLGMAPATPTQVAGAGAAVARARASMGAPLPMAGLPERLLAAAGSPRWAEIAERCLACTNCTLVCPTCFCTSTAQVSDLLGSRSVTERMWDSCFSSGFAAVAGGTFRGRVQDRYRQWLTHKHASWWEQFGSSGCVGCGRCITWCPVGIDIRAELLAIAPPPPGATVLEPLAVEPAGPNPAGPNLAPPMPGPTPVVALVHAVRRETDDTVTLRLLTDDPALLRGQPGQFVMAGLPAMAAPPISVSRFHPDGLELTIRAAGPATLALCGLRAGDTLGLRGPLGRGWPVEAARGRDVMIVTGGIGLAPLRPLLDAILAERDQFGAVRLCYGARRPADLLYTDELAALARRGVLEVATTVDRADPGWDGRVGIVTTLLEGTGWDGTAATAFVCGPERMMEATAASLRGLGVTPDRILLTLERHMDCGVGLCGHCQVGPLFVCRDGPVFSLAELGDGAWREGW